LIRATGLYSYCEVFPDEGEVDFLKVIRILRDTQFSGSICPDHMPKHPDDPGSFQAYAFGYGAAAGDVDGGTAFSERASNPFADTATASGDNCYQLIDPAHFASLPPS
jgi:hypothetical protein